MFYSTSFLLIIIKNDQETSEVLKTENERKTFYSCSRKYSYASIGLFALQCFVVFFPEWFKMTDYDSLFGSKLMVRKGIWLKESSKLESYLKEIVLTLKVREGFAWSS